MVDFNKLIKSSDKFRLAALTFIATGRYCTYPQGSSEYFKFWDLEKDRCINGYTADDGDYITGYNYFYLNYCPIQRMVYTKNEKTGKIKKSREVTFPDFYDYDYYFFLGVNDAEELGKHMCVLKSRRKGFSYKMASACCRNYYLIPGSKSYVYASNKQYLTEDGILTKAWDYMDFIDKNTAWGKKRSVNTLMRKRAGFFSRDEYGNEVELGYKSEIIGVTLKDNASACRGKAGKLIIFEEAGSFTELAAAWQIARPSVEQDGVAFGLMLAQGTGGDEASHFATLKDMFYHPEGYNCISFPNIWDETATTKECGFFVPLYTNMDFRDSEGKRIYMDEDGNTYRKKALEYLLEERRKVIENATSNEAIDRWVCEHCLTPAEAMLEFNGNIFPKKELLEQLALLRTNTKLLNHKQVGDLVWESDGSLKWIIKKTGDITHYPLRLGEDPTGSIVIWEHPNKEASLGLYIAGCLTPGEKVLTDKGYKAVEEVTFDDKLVSKDGEYVDIRNLLRYYKENETIYKVRVSHSYSTTTFTSEHPLYVATEAHDDYEFTPVKNIKVGLWIKYPNIYKRIYNLTLDEILETQSLTSNNLTRLEIVQDMLFSVGVISNITRDDEYRLVIQEDCDDCFFSDDLNYIYFKIREIEESKYTGTVYNFECDTHTFLCRCITTHNCDSYDYDESTTTSLGSFFIYKRIQSIEEYSDIIVAEYTGRPKTADEFYENVRKLLIYYNARCMYENLNKGIFAYFANKHCDYLLADQPDIISDIIKDSKVQRKKGCHMNKLLKQWGWGLIKDWLNEVNADGKKNLYNIMSEPLLEELIAANDVVNVDRVMALTLLMIYREELYNVKVKEIKKENRERILFDGPIFTQEWFRDDGTDNIEAYMF